MARINWKYVNSREQRARSKDHQPGTTRWAQQKVKSNVIALAARYPNGQNTFKPLKQVQGGGHPSGMPPHLSQFPRLVFADVQWDYIKCQSCHQNGLFMEIFHRWQSIQYGFRFIELPGYELWARYEYLTFIYLYFHFARTPECGVRSPDHEENNFAGLLSRIFGMETH